MNQKLVISTNIIATFPVPNIHREGGDIELFITLVPKVLKRRFLICFSLKTLGALNQF